jgi:uncharacterized RDD family membrane protein YckC
VKIDARVTYEGFGRRLLSGLLDLALVLAVIATLVLLGLAASDAPAQAPALAADLLGYRGYAVWSLVLVFLAQCLFWTFLGATPGMLLLGCQVLRADSGRRLSLARSVLRCLGLWLGLACLGIGVLWSIRDRRHQGLHDKLADSVVVREDESLMPLEELVEGLH